MCQRTTIATLQSFFKAKLQTNFVNEAGCLQVHTSNRTVEFLDAFASESVFSIVCSAGTRETTREGRRLGTNQSEKGTQAAGKGTRAASSWSTKWRCTEINKAKLNPLPLTNFISGVGKQFQQHGKL